MATAYNKMKNSIEEKYAAQDYEQEYYAVSYTHLDVYKRQM